MLDVRSGTVTRYNRVSGLGEVDVSGSRYPFGITTFDSGRPARSPRPGEQVEVVFTEAGSDPLTIRAKQ